MGNNEKAGIIRPFASGDGSGGSILTVPVIRKDKPASGTLTKKVEPGDRFPPLCPRFWWQNQLGRGEQTSE